MKDKKIIIGIIGSSIEPHNSLSIPLGRWIAKKGYHLVNGGGGGVMESASKSFSETLGREGLVLGIIPSHRPCDSKENRENRQSLQNYPNAYIDVPIQTHLYLSGIRGKETASRNHIVSLTANIVVALPGGLGTRSEIELAMEYGRPLILLSPSKEWQEFENTAAIILKRIENVYEEIERQISLISSN